MKITQTQEYKDLDTGIIAALIAVNSFKGKMHEVSPLNEMEIPELAELQEALKQAHVDLSVALKEIGKIHDIIRKGVLPEKLQAAKIDNLTINGIGNVTLVDDLYTSILNDDKERALEWLEDHGHGDIITRNVHPSNLKSLMKEKLKEGEKIPEYIKVVPYKYTRIRSQRHKNKEN